MFSYVFKCQYLQEFHDPERAHIRIIRTCFHTCIIVLKESQRCRDVFRWQHGTGIHWVEPSMMTFNQWSSDSASFQSAMRQTDSYNLCNVTACARSLDPSAWLSSLSFVSFSDFVASSSSTSSAWTLFSSTASFNGSTSQATDCLTRDWLQNYPKL